MSSIFYSVYPSAVFYLGYIPAFLLNFFGPIITLILIAIFCGFLIYKARASQTQRISLFLASTVLLLSMGNVGFLIMNQNDAQTAIWMVFGSGMGIVLTIVTYFLVWLTMVFIRCIEKFTKRIWRR